MQSHSKTPRSPRRCDLRLVPFEPCSVSFAVRTQLTLQWNRIAVTCAAWQKVVIQNGQYSVDTVFIVSTSIYWCLRWALDAAFIAGFFHWWTRAFVNVTCLHVVCPTSGKSVQVSKCQWGIPPPRCAKLTRDSLCCCGCCDAVTRENMQIDSAQSKTLPVWKHPKILL